MCVCVCIGDGEIIDTLWRTWLMLVEAQIEAGSMAGDAQS